MAEGTRFKVIESQVQQLQQFGESVKAFMEETRAKEDKVQKSVEETKQQIQDLRKDLASMIQGLMSQPRTPAPNPDLDLSVETGGRGTLASGGKPLLGMEARAKEASLSVVRSMSVGIHRNENQATKAHLVEEHHSSWNQEFRGNRFPKIDFPTFDGNKPRSWIRKCEKFFAIFAIQEAQRVEFAAMYVNGRADIWLQGFLMQKSSVSWSEFKEAVCARFGERQGSDIVEEFNKLEQGDDMEDYNEQFEELRACMLSINPQLPESYFVSSYISGLRNEIKALVKLSHPVGLVEAFDQARLHNNAVQAIVKISKNPWKAPSSENFHKNSGWETRNPVKSAVSSQGFSASTVGPMVNQPAVDSENSETREMRRASGLCYRCGDKYFVGHRCKTQSLHSLLAAQLGDVERVELENSDQIGDDTHEIQPATKPKVYVHALSGNSPLTTITIKGVANGKELTVLIDSGATHSFIDPIWATDAGFKLKQSGVMEVSMVNGEKMCNTQVCQSFRWTMQDCDFTFNPRVLKLGGCDLVLGGDWLRQYSPIQFDFRALKISFQKDGKDLEFKGVTEEGSLKSIRGVIPLKIPLRCKKMIAQVAQCFTITGHEM